MSFIDETKSIKWSNLTKIILCYLEEKNLDPNEATELVKKSCEEVTDQLLRMQPGTLVISYPVFDKSEVEALIGEYNEHYDRMDFRTRRIREQEIFEYKANMDLKDL